MEKKHYVCIACPRSCRLTVWEEAGEIKVEGATCKRGTAHGQNDEGSIELEPHRVAQTFSIGLAEELSGEDTRPRKSAEQAEGKDEDQLVGDAYPRELLRAKATDHHVVQEVDEIGNPVLDDDGNGDAQDHFIEGLGADKFFYVHGNE